MPRKRAFGRPRYPGGKLKPIGETSPTLIRRMIDQARRGAGNPLLGSELGRLCLNGVISDREFSAGVRYGVIVGRYHRLKGLPSPHLKSAAFMDGYGRTLADDPEAEIVAKAERQYLNARSVFLHFGRRVLNIAEAVIIHDQVTDASSQRSLGIALAQLYGSLGLTQRAA